MKLFLPTILFLFLSTTVWAAPNGEWVADFYGSVGTINLSESQFSFKLDSEGESGGNQVGFSGPVAKVTESRDGGPGKLIIGPIKNGPNAYEVVWFYSPTGPRARFLWEESGYDDLTKAEGSTFVYDTFDAGVFLAKDYFQQVNALPPMAALSRDQFLALLSEALQRHEATPGEDFSVIMETLMMDKGHHPTKSREAFEAALEQFGDDPEIDGVLKKLQPEGDEQ